jgi:hydroxyacylglutathione hydrolase
VIEIFTIDTPTLGDRSYLVADGEVAFVVDPQRDIDRVLKLVDSHHLRLTHVFETHVHNDYVTGGYALARLTGAEYVVAAGDQVDFQRLPIADGEAIPLGAGMTIQAIATPGHTFTHLSYVLDADGDTRAAFTGGSLLYSSTGRPDLLGDEHTNELARAQHRSVQRLAAQLPNETVIYPTHGFGGFCAASEGETPSGISTVAAERRVNSALRLDEGDYVRDLLAGLDAYPAYYAHMGPRNTAGPEAADLSPVGQADPAALARRIADGEWIVDLRSGDRYAAGHLAGTLNFGLDGSFAPYLGWLIPWGTSVTLLADTTDDIAEAQRELARIGVDRPAGAATGPAASWSVEDSLRSFPVAGFKDLAAHPGRDDLVVLDVRRRSEWRDGYIEGAVNIPLHELPGRLADVPPGEVWVHCMTGYRTAIAASMLDRAGRRVVAVRDDFEAAGDTGLTLVHSA